MRELTASHVGVQEAAEQLPAVEVVALRLEASTANALGTPTLAWRAASGEWLVFVRAIV